jgi:hypothetical protein
MGLMGRGQTECSPIFRRILLNVLAQIFGEEFPGPEFFNSHA